MKSGLILASLLAFTPLSVPYGAFFIKSAGNPDWQPYLGETGSLYDAAANPAQTVGTVTYDPYAPLPTVNPSTPSGSASGTMTPPG